MYHLWRGGGNIIMKEYKVTCWASEEIFVEAENKQEAEELATEQCGFPYVDYCEIEE